MLALLIAASALLAILVELDSDKTVWRQRPLTYDQPKIPNEFEDNGRAKPTFLWGTLLEDTYDNGSDLFLRQHRRGWAHFRSYFYEEYSEFLGPRKLDLDRFETLSKTEWTDEHWRYPYDLGYATCAQQIEQFLKHESEESLRNMIGYPRYWHATFYLTIMLLSLGASVYLQPKRRITNG